VRGNHTLANPTLRPYPRARNSHLTVSLSLADLGKPPLLVSILPALAGLLAGSFRRIEKANCEVLERRAIA
jgi:hypothetical protein